MRGEVLAIHIAPTEGAPPVAVAAVEAVAGRGLVGDRHLAPEDAIAAADPEDQVTLIETEALDAIRLEHGIEVTPAESRRNIATRGIRLNDLVDREFSVGDVRLRGVKLCEPCGYLQRTLGISRLVQALAGRGGLNAEILGGGEIRVGDPIVPD